jgi:hypothetical protein
VARLTLEELERRRTFECRLTPDRALETLEEAKAFLDDRGLLTLMPGSTLPSLFAACHEEPYLQGKGGFAEYPRTKYVWAWELRKLEDVHWLKVHRGKGVLVTEGVARLADPLARAALASAVEGTFGAGPQRLVAHLASAGPSLLDELKEELDFDARTLRGARARLEPLGAIVAREAILPTPDGGHRHSSELLRWDQLRPEPSPGGLEDLVVAGVRAAVLAPESEPARWFSWRLPAGTVDRLVEEGRLVRVDGHVAAPPAPPSRSSDS